LTTQAEATHGTCSAAAQKRWWPMNWIDQSGCNSALAKSIEENKVGSFRRRQ
jgi:hypothetical protein